MKGIILAGGKGTRLYPSSKVICKQLMPVYDKPMIYYPLSILMISGIKDILLITNPEDRESFEKLLGDGSKFGCKFSYEIQDKPNGLAEAFIIGENFIKNDNVCLILGDNLIYGSGLGTILRSQLNSDGASIFAIEVEEPSNYGVVEFDSKGNILSIEEKPINPKSKFAIPGIYYYNNSVIQYAKMVKPSKRGEKEITDLNKIYLENKLLKVNKLPRGITWLDTGTPENFYEASEFVRVVQKRTYKKIACIEEIAYRMNYINKDDLQTLIKEKGKNDYSDYLKGLYE
jgi:glucose-1-phosphate thymidylyltransferase